MVCEMQAPPFPADRASGMAPDGLFSLTLTLTLCSFNCFLRAQLSLYSSSLGYAGLATGASSGIQMMAKSRALPWKESPAHLEGMVGNKGFDPWGLSTPQNIKWMREAELKHGRMCQLAWLVSSAAAFARTAAERQRTQRQRPDLDAILDRNDAQRAGAGHGNQTAGRERAQ